MKDIQYRHAILIEIEVPYIIYTLTHGVNFLICNELFAIGSP